MRASRPLRRLAGWLLAAVVTTALSGFVHYRDDSGIYLIKWYQSPVVMHLSLPTTTNLSDGSSLSGSVAAALQTWNAHLGVIQFSAGPARTPGYTLGNEINEVALGREVDGDEFPEGVLALTMNYTYGNDIAESDIVFNSAGYTWDSYRGPVRMDRQDVRRVAVHELGHVLGLDHPDEHAQYVTAIMNSRVSSTETPQTDDINGVRALYGTPGVRPANDHFAAATEITLASDWAQVTGSNIAATRESGESGHAGATSEHSVWWKWTAPANGRMVVSTVGSDFDTVLAIYTGTSVSALARIGANDDEESPEQNETPQRKRTSRVEFDATAGTTYALAVDGWGDADQVPAGYTGAIVLRLDFTVVVAPVFVTQPTDLTIAAGQKGGFVVDVSGRPYPERTWQRRAKGAGAWTDLTYDAVYTGGQSGGSGHVYRSYLWIETEAAMDGDQFRCVATNLGGTAYSNTVTLHVTSIPLPEITEQPQAKRLLRGIKGWIRVKADRTTRYQWYRDGQPLADRTTPDLIFADPQPADAGEYHVECWNAGGTVSSTKVTVTVAAPPVVTNVGAARRSLSGGETLTLQVTAQGTGALQYQWYHNGREVAGATNATLTRRITSAADTGAYWAAVTDDLGTRHGAPFFTFVSRPATNVVAWGANSWGQLEVPTGLSDAIAVSAGDRFALALRSDGSVVAWGDTAGQNLGFSDAVAICATSGAALALKSDGRVVASGWAAPVPAGLKDVWAVAAVYNLAVALRTDGTVATWGGESPPPNTLENIVAVSGDLVLRRDGLVSRLWRIEITDWSDTLDDGVVALADGDGSVSLGLNAQGTVVWNSPPAGATNVIAIAAGAQHALALKADGTVLAWYGSNTYGECSIPAGLGAAFAVAAGGYTSFAIRDTTRAQPLLVTAQPQSPDWVHLHMPAQLFAYAAGGGAMAPSYQWQRNGVNIPGATGARLSLPSVEPGDAGIYSAMISAETQVTTSPAIIGLALPGEKVAGTAQEVGRDILHPNGNVFDQVLMTGGAGVITADRWAQQITRTSFIDVDGDIVQVEFSGPGTLSLVLDAVTGPAAPEKYTQPDVSYMKGHVGIVITGAEATTHVSIFTVGRATAFDPTGRYDLTKAISTTNDPVNNGSPLFAGHESTLYGGVADLAFVAIKSAQGRFGGLRAANAHFFADKGYTGIYAPRIEFMGPVYVGDLSAYGEARPVLVLGSANDVRVTGGDMLQDNGEPVQVSGIAQLKFTAGSDSHGRVLPAQPNRARYQRNGVDVTAEIVVNP